MKKLLLLAAILITGIYAHATHIVGGYMAYSYISDSTYQIKLTVYRDCNSSTGFDNPAPVGLFDATTRALAKSYSANNPVITRIQPPADNPCLQINTNVCVEQGVYTFNVTLPSTSKGYIISYQRCCRQGSISNVTLPGDVGETFFAYIPPTTVYQNTSPTFNVYPPIYICLNSPLIYNHSASDVDGDVLRYSLCTPYSGATVNSPSPNPPSKPPYANIPWANGYSTANLLGGVPLAIDSLTGVLTGTPNTVGQFVVGVCVSEYRNGQLIATYLRDFQFNVTQCNIPVANIPSSNIDPNTGVGTYVSNCTDYQITFKNNSYNPPPTSTPLAYQWDFGVPGITNDTSSLTAPSYTYPDTGTFLVRLISKKGTGASACSDTAFAFVRIYPTMDAAFSLKDTCLGTAAVFTDNSTNAYGTINNWNWNFGDGITSTLQNPPHVYAAKGTYNITFISGNSLGCKDTIQKTINIYTTSQGTFTAPDGCTGAPVNFTTAMNGGYQWHFGDGKNSNLQNPTNNYSAPGTYTVSLISHTANGCIDSVAKPITISPGPVVQTSNDTTICPAGSVQLSATGGGAYEWTPSTGLSNSTIANPLATPTTATGPIIYKVKVTSQNQCVTIDSVIVSFFTVPVVTAGPDTLFCLVGGTDSNKVQMFATGGVSYHWSPITGLSDANIANPVSTLPGGIFINYVVEVTDQHQCVSRDTASISSYPVSVIAGPDTMFCLVPLTDTNTIQLFATGGTNYSWTPNIGLSDTSIANPIARIPSTLAITYIVQTTNDHQCIDRDTVHISFFTPIPVSAGPDILYCVGTASDGVQLEATGNASYIWSPSQGLSDTTIGNPLANPSISTTYTVIGTDIHGCKSADTLAINVQPLPVTSLTGDTTVCSESVQLAATGGDTYIWEPSTGLNCTDCATPVTSTDTTTKYFVQIKDTTTGCIVTDSVTITVEGVFISAFYTDSTIIKGDTITLGVNAKGGNGLYQYQWSPADYLDNAGIANPLATPQTDIVYTVTVTSGICNDTTSTSIHLFLSDVLVKVPSAFTPNGDGHNSTFGPVIFQDRGTVKDFRVYNRFGQLIHNSTEAWDGRFKGAEQPVGTYVYYMVIAIPDKADMKLQGSVTLLR